MSRSVADFELPQEDLRKRATFAASLLLLVHGVYTVVQGVALWAVSLPPSVEPTVLGHSMVVNAAVDLTLLLYLTLNLRRGRSAPETDRWLLPSTVALVSLLFIAWGVQLHFGGSQSSHMLALILATLVVVAWLLPERVVVALALANSAYLAGLVWLELAGVLPYSPLVHGAEDLAGVYLDGRIVAMNLVIYLCVFGATAVTLLSLRRALARRRAELTAANRSLQDEIDERERTQRTLRRAVDELGRASEGQQRALRGAAHDLRAPLTSISFLTTKLERSVDGAVGEEIQPLLGKIQDSVWRMSDLLDGLSQLVLGGGEEQPIEPCDCERVLDRVLGALEAELAASGATIVRGHLPRVMAREAGLAQVLQNLLGNALKFRAERPPEIRIEALRRGERWEIVLQDNGIGFPPAMAERIFEPFERLESREHYAGHGIGLALCRQAVGRMGGSIWAEGRPGEGATFHLSLPAAPPA
jgi:signal transduction histidine kinase